MTKFEDLIRVMTNRRSGDYPRPWMTDMDPGQADVLIVGASSAKTFRVADVGNHDQFIDALWNRNGRTCRAMYDAATTKRSRTRPNLDRLSTMLDECGLTWLQTNVSCASARYDNEVSKEDRAHGTKLFKVVVEHVPWRAMIVYGVGASKRFGLAFDVEMPPVPSPDSAPTQVTVRGRTVFVSPTLAPPSYRTSVWPYLERVVAAIANGGAATDTFAAQSKPPLTSYPPTLRPRPDGISSCAPAKPTDFKKSPANDLVWQRMHEIAEASSLAFVPRRQQAKLTDGPEFSSTTRVFRHKFNTVKPDLLVREDVLKCDEGLLEVAAWTTHKTPVFRAVRTDDLQLLGRILDAVEEFAAVRAT